jgi:hypothetical protein
MSGSDLMADAVTAFGNEIGVALNVDSDNYCCLSINDNMQLHMKFNDYFNGIVFYAELGEIPESNQYNALKYFAQANCNKSISGGMTFSYDEESKNLGLASLLPGNFINIDSLKKILEKFIMKAETTRNIIIEFTQGISPAGTTTAAVTPDSQDHTHAMGDQFMKI